MNDSTKDNKRNENDHQEDLAMNNEMQGLKRDMQSAKLADWAQKNQQKLMAMAVAVVFALVAGGLWAENSKSQRNAAATLYHQALAVNDTAQKQTLLETVIKDYNGSGYASLSHLQLAKSGSDAESHLKALAFGSGVPQELAWQARLDLAEAYLNDGKLDASKEMLSEPVGKQYEQLRFYLLSQVVAVDSEKKEYLQKSLDAISNDEVLKNKVEALLSVASLK
ncbi:MAG: tetratricopeptide repeat protein [Mariprofundaceae bacterium]